MDKAGVYLIPAFVLAFICPVRLEESMCPPGAKWSDCSGCWSRCPVKDMFCLTVCIEGCVCEEPGFVMHEGACIPITHCPDTEIKVPETTCPPGAKWSTCSGCGSYCPVKDMSCLTVCREGCVCEEPGFVIHEGACIPISKCPNTEIKAPETTCPPGAKWSSCSGCGSYCPVKDKFCLAVCREGCVCEEPGFVIHEGACIPISKCPAFKKQVPETTCPPGAKWSTCSGCGSYCPVKDTFCAAVCREGCVCEEPGFVIHEGACIPISKCPETQLNESSCPPGTRMSDCAGCWSRCPTQDMNCSTECAKGCVCKAKGQVISNGVCIPASMCPVVPEKALTCPPGARPYDCAGCWSFCPIKDAVCPVVCQKGCACTQKGYVIHENACIPANECPIIPKPGKTCPFHTQWAHCSSCHDYCPVVGRQCDQVCRIGCVCKKKAHVLYKGQCIPRRMCPQSFEDVPACPQHAIWSPCPRCNSYCFPKNDCKTVCRGGCVCRKKRYVFHEGNCIRPNECPHV